MLMYLSVNSFQYCLYWCDLQITDNSHLIQKWKCLNNVCIKMLGWPVFSVFHETITSDLVGYYIPLNIPSTENDKNFISGNHYPDRHNTGAPSEVHTGPNPCPWASFSYAEPAMSMCWCGLRLRTWPMSNLCDLCLCILNLPSLFRSIFLHRNLAQCWCARSVWKNAGTRIIQKCRERERF